MRKAMREGEAVRMTGKRERRKRVEGERMRATLIWRLGWNL